MRVIRGGTLGLIALVAGVVLVGVPAVADASTQVSTTKSTKAVPLPGSNANVRRPSARPHTPAAAKAVFESTKRGRAERKGLATARRRHGLRPGIPVPAWALKRGPHVNFTPSPRALRRLQDVERRNGAAGEPESVGSPGGPQGVAGENAKIRTGQVPPIRYLGGVVQHHPTVHLIFWGSNWSGHTSELLQLYQGLTSSSYQGILTQYFDSTGYIANEVSVDSVIDPRVAAPSNVNDSSLQAEIAYAEGIWGHSLETQYQVLAAPGSTYEPSFFEGESFCAYHDVASSGAVYSFVPYEGDEPFANGSYCPWYGYGNAYKATTVLASHEYAESATDPLWDTAPGWRNHASSQGEISDICATPGDTLESGVMAQGQYDDHLAKCAVSDSNPPHVLGLSEPATNVTETSATLNATVNPEGSATSYYFEYGTSKSYGQSLPAEPLGVGSGWGDVHVSQTLSGLQTEQAYHYRVVAANASGTTYGEDHTAIPSKWRIATPAPGGSWSESWLNDISCAAESSCMTVGYYGQAGASNGPNQALSYQKTANGWIQRPVPHGEGAVTPELEGVSCPPAGLACVAVGEEKVSGPYRPLVVRWNGKEWLTEHLTPPAGTLGVELYGVSCVGWQAQECIAVGSVKNAAGVWVDYSAELSGGVWSSLSTPTGEATLSEVRDVDCHATLASCVAVGWYNPVGGGASKPFSLAMSSSGQWEFQSRSWRGYLKGVTCQTFAETCIAVGTRYGYGGGPSTETWDGSEWSAPSVASLSDASGGYLGGVSCEAAGNCIAVGAGWSEVGGASVTLAEQLSGEASSERTTPRESEVAPNWLSSVECVGSTCMAVGQSKASDNPQALLETRDIDKRPAVYTEAPSGIKAVEEVGQATLHGAVNPNGLETEYHFEWAKPWEYSIREYNHLVPVPDGAVGSGETTVAVSQTISPLNHNTSYHYRLVASNAEGTTIGPDHTVVTPDWRPQINDEHAEAIGGSRATLTAKIDPEGFETKWGIHLTGAIRRSPRTTRGRPLQARPRVGDQLAVAHRLV